MFAKGHTVTVVAPDQAVTGIHSVAHEQGVTVVRVKIGEQDRPHAHKVVVSGNHEFEVSQPQPRR